MIMKTIRDNKEVLTITLSEVIRNEIDRMILDSLGRTPEENKKIHNWYYKI